jgi:hypothetical protein
LRSIADPLAASATQDGTSLSHCGLPLAPIRQEIHMSSLKTLAALTAVAFVSACASPGAPNTAKADEHASHHPDAAATAPAAAMPAMQERMKAMREMHDKMMNAKTPAERQALMADHMKSMQGGMEMMKGMGGMADMGAMGSMGGAMGDGKGMPAEMAKRHQMMEGRMEMMQTMMEMMMQRLPNPPATK